MRGLIGVLLIAGVIVFAEGRARADDHDWGSGGDCGTGCAVASGVILGIVDVVFLGADLGYGVQGRWLPGGWAWGQTIWGGGNLLLGVVMTPLGALVKDKNMLGLGIGFGVLGAWFFVHGVISLVKWYAAPRHLRGVRAAPGRHLYLPDLAFGPTGGGGGAGVLSWTF